MIVLYAFLGLLAFLLILALVLPGRYDVHKSTIIQKPVGEVFLKVADLHYFHDWNPWQKTEPSAKADIQGQAASIGHSYSWDGKKIGMGSLTISSLEKDKSIDFVLNFIKPWKATASDTWRFEPDGEKTKVIWRNNGELSFPIARLMGPVINKQLNRQFVEGLRNLKQLCEG